MGLSFINACVWDFEIFFFIFWNTFTRFFLRLIYTFFKEGRKFCFLRNARIFCQTPIRWPFFLTICPEIASTLFPLWVFTAPICLKITLLVFFCAKSCKKEGYAIKKLCYSRVLELSVILLQFLLDLTEECCHAIVEAGLKQYTYWQQAQLCSQESLGTSFSYAHLIFVDFLCEVDFDDGIAKLCYQYVCFASQF